jgi:hypothetical protein
VPKKDRSGCLLWGTLFFSPFLIFGAAFLYFGFAKPFLSEQRASDWVQTPCVIESCSLGRSESTTTDSNNRKSTSEFFSIDVTYTYEVDEQTYTSDRYDFNVLTDGVDDWKRDVVRRLPTGTKTVCWVAPDDPTEAVLTKAPNISIAVAIPPAIFALFGLAGLLFTYSTLLDKNRNVDSPDQESSSNQDGSDDRS